MANCSITLSDYNSIEWLMKNEAASAPITFAEIVMVMISQNKQWVSITTRFRPRLPMISIWLAERTNEH